MLEKITEAEINERSMARVSNTPGRRTAFGQSEMDAEALKLRFDRLGRFLAGKINEILGSIDDGVLAKNIKVVKTVGSQRIEYPLAEFILKMVEGDLTQINVKVPEGTQRLDVICNQVLRWNNEFYTGDFAGEVVIVDDVTLKGFYEEFKAFEGETAPVQSVNGKKGDVELKAEDVGARPDTWMPSAADVGARPNTWTPTAEEVGARPNTWTPGYSEVGADKAGTADSKVSAHNVSDASHNDIRLLIQGLADRINAIANSTDIDLDDFKEVVAYIKANRGLIDAITTNKINYTDIINDLVTNVTSKPLSAAQGVAIKGLIDNLTNSKLDASALTSAINTALAQAKASGEFDGKDGKTAYEYAKDGGYTGTEAEFSQALAEIDDIEIPTKVSELTNDSKFITKDDIPVASGTVAGITVVYPAASCTTFSSDSGTVTPLAVQKGAKQFAITRPSSSTNNAITRYSNTTGDVKDSKIVIEDVTNTKDSSKKAQVIAVPAEGGKKMVYGYCTDQVDGTSFIGGLFSSTATSYPYSEGLAIGGSSGNLLWKGDKVVTTPDLAGYATTSAVNNKLDASALPSAVDTALAQAKASGAFDGKDGTNYVLTDADRTQIANIVTTQLGGQPVYGVVDANKVVTLRGTLELDDTYTFGYIKNGEFVEIGKGEYVPDEPAVPAYNNILTDSAYTSNIKYDQRWSGSNNAYSACTGMISIPVPLSAVLNKTVRLKGFEKDLKASSKGASWYIYNGTTKVGTCKTSDNDGSGIVWKCGSLVDEGNGVYAIPINTTSFNSVSNGTTLHITLAVKSSASVSASDLADKIITIDEPIV